MNGAAASTASGGGVAENPAGALAQLVRIDRAQLPALGTGVSQELLGNGGIARRILLVHYFVVDWCDGLWLGLVTHLLKIQRVLSRIGSG